MKRFFILALLFFLPAISAFAEEELSDYETLLMFYKEEELVVSPTRFLKPITKTAENITVITAKDIELMNAHTLNDVLNGVTGIQIDMRGNSASSDAALIQGSDGRHVLVVVDGVTLNNLVYGNINFGMYPLQNIERIEVIKGPASSSWGSSLGGVINIITKGTGVFEKPEGTLYGSYGEKKSLDGRLEVAGKNEDLSYYVYGGSNSSDGLRPYYYNAFSNFYGKAKYDVSDDLSLQLSSGYNWGKLGWGTVDVFGINYEAEFEQLFVTLNADYAISENSGLDLTLYMKQEDSRQPIFLTATGTELSRTVIHENSRGVSLKYSWQDKTNSIVLGGDFDDSVSRANIYTGDLTHNRKTWDVFINDTLSLGKLTLIPGVRYDSTSTNGAFLSPSFGATFAVDEQTLLRADVARGFNIPPLSMTYSTSFFYDPKKGKSGNSLKKSRTFGNWQS